MSASVALPQRYGVYLDDYTSYTMKIPLLFTQIYGNAAIVAQAEGCFPERSSNIYSKTINSQRRYNVCLTLTQTNLILVGSLTNEA